jgi:hypothetical protein
MVLNPCCRGGRRAHLGYSIAEKGAAALGMFGDQRGIRGTVGQHNSSSVT